MTTNSMTTNSTTTNSTTTKATTAAAAASTTTTTTTTTDSIQPPYYILVSQSSFSRPSQNAAALSSSLSHPIIQYHYMDDPLTALLPVSPTEHVLLLKYGHDPDGDAQRQLVARSLSPHVAITHVKVAEAPGAAGGENKVNDKMYVLETTVAVEDKPSLGTSQPDLQSAQAALVLFQQINAALRRSVE